ncbi:MAG: UDP-N-acetylmuramate dehydrogenase [Eubacteriales bacterium]|nr:UDP-N-acetylmuramate dehydrogenase [Eubacteriales bacterium]
MNINNIRRITKGIVMRNEPMSAHTTFRTGGNADCYIVPRTAAELSQLIKYFKLNNLPYYIIGNGSNMLVSDKGYRGAIIDLGRNDNTELTLLGYEWVGDKLQLDAGAGCTLTTIGSVVTGLGGTGFEELTGIPGCIGGACIMNAGAYGREMKDVLTSVEVIDKNGNRKKLGKEQLELRYRGSNLMDEGYIVCRAEFELDKGEPDAIKAKCEELLNRRKESQPLEYPSAGSTFKRPEGYFAGKLISDAGLKGFGIGGAEVSAKHAGFIINKGHATSSDIYALIKHVQKTVKEASGVDLVPEVRLLGDFE